MTVVWYLLGAGVITLGLADVFLSVLAYDSAGLLVQPAYRTVWLGVRLLSTRLSANAGATLRSLAAPLMVVFSVLVWMMLQIVGFALLYYPSVVGSALRLDGMSHTFWTALYISTAAISSLGFMGTGAHGLGLRLLAACETLIGLSVFTLTVTYLLGLYSVVQEAAVAWVVMQHRSNNTTPSGVLNAHFFAPSSDDFSALWRDFHHILVNYLEGMRRYPVVYYFHTRQRRRSLPLLLWSISETSSAVRWGLPEGHLATTNPWLPGLLEAYRQAVTEVGRRVGAPEPRSVPSSVDLETFAKARATGQTSHPDVKDFLDLERAMADLAHIPCSTDTTEAFGRYRQWTQFHAMTLAFVGWIGADFGVSLSAAQPDR